MSYTFFIVGAIIFAIYVWFTLWIIFNQSKKQREEGNGTQIDVVDMDGTENVADEPKDVTAVIRNKPIKLNLKKLTKTQLVAAAKTDFDVNLDIKARKSLLVNKVYSLYN